MRRNDIQRAGPGGDPQCPHQRVHIHSKGVGANRIVFGGDFTAPTGNPDLPLDREKAYRRKIIDKALEALTTHVPGPTIFTVDESKEG